MFIVMEYIEGKELKNVLGVRRTVPLSIDDVINYATQIAKGLDAAHKKGIVHRDIKSGNIMITGDDHLKIMDFGLAKVRGGTLVTKAGTTLGTAAYMSPEQAQGEEVDHRSDIWAFGVVLYEMLTGQLPFSGNYEAAVAYSILNEDPSPVSQLNPDVPDAMSKIVDKLLKKNASERYQSMVELLSELTDLKMEQSSASSSTQIPLGDSHKSITLKKKNITFLSTIALVVIVSVLSFWLIYPSKTDSIKNKSIAVLPFADMSSERDQEYFCDGLAEELINALTKINGIRVASRTSAFQFKGKELDIRTIGEKLNVSTVLEGSLRKSDQKLRITAQLINVEDGFHLWSETYEKDLEDIFAIQDQLTRSIVNALEVKLASNKNEPIMKHSTTNIEAYNLYLQGRYYWNKRTEESMSTGLRFFQQAVEEDPAYAPAYAGIADSYLMLTDWSYMAPREGFPKARAAALKALEIDNSLAEAQTNIAYISFIYDWNWETAEKEFKRAIKLNPNYAIAHMWYADYLSFMGRQEEGYQQINLAEKLDPLSLIIKAVKGFLLYVYGRNEEAIAQLNKTLEMDPDFFPALYFLQYTYEDEKRNQEAITIWKKILILQGATTEELSSLDAAFKSGGMVGTYKWKIQQLNERIKQKYVSPADFFEAYTGMGDIEMAFKWLEKAYQERIYTIPWLKYDPRAKILRSDPRFNGYLKKIGPDK
jgi:serine/threonine-protein kinase